ncbi:MAG: type IX secretion system membrane protein PorP/SprF [Sphingobacteriaceae bacterium]|nr:MAG: type IX secretion system membrane protein PorP/SprF [Sphingobacteriaceae bacterium]
MKKGTIFFMLFSCCTLSLFAQQKPQYTQYVFNNYLLNPAFAGIENFVDLKLGHRSQWSGLEGAPLTTYLTVNAPFGEGFLNGGSGSGNPAERSYLSNYMAAEPHHGIGLTLVSDNAGIISTTNIGGTYAYHLGVTSTVNLAVGVTAGLSQFSINKSAIKLENENDPAVINNTGTRWSPDISFGTVLYGANYFIGMSVQQLLPQRLFAGDFNSTAKTTPHFLFNVGTRLYINDDISVLPSALIKFIEPLPATFDLNMKMAFRDKFWIGGSYRYHDSFGALAGFNLSSLINIGYSYDFNTSALNTVSNGSHEIVLGIMLNNKYNVSSSAHGF